MSNWSTERLWSLPGQPAPDLAQALGTWPFIKPAEVSSDRKIATFVPIPEVVGKRAAWGILVSCLPCVGSQGLALGSWRKAEPKGEVGEAGPEGARTGREGRGLLRGAGL